MSHVQIIVTAGGERLAVLPEAEYQRLVEAAEDAADAAVLRERSRKIAAGEDVEGLPIELLKRILDGESPVRVYRDHRGLTAAQLGEKAGLSRAYITQIETGKKEGSVSSLKAIAAALQVGIDDLVP